MINRKEQNSKLSIKQNYFSTYQIKKIFSHYDTNLDIFLKL